MGSFPTYIAQRKTNPLPNAARSPAVPANAFGIGFGQQIQVSADLAMRRAIEMAEEDDRLAAQRALIAADEEGLLYLYGSDETPGVLSLTGHAALGSSTAARKDLNSIGKMHAQGLNPRALARYQDEWGKRSSELFGAVSRNESGQRVVARKEIMDDSLRVSREAIAREPLDPDVVDSAMYRSYIAMQTAGKSPEAIREELANLDTFVAGEQGAALLRMDPLAYADVVVAEDGPFADRPRSWKDAERDRALELYQSRSAAERANQAHEWRLSDRAEAERYRATIQEGDDLYIRGKLTPGWLEVHSAELPKEDRRFYLGKLTGEGSENDTDPEVYTSLYERAGQGEDVRAEARLEYTTPGGGLDQDDYKAIVNRYEDDAAIPEKFKAGEEYINVSMGADETLLRFGARNRKAKAFRAWRRTIRDKPDMTEAEAESAADDIVNRYSIVDPSEMAATLDPPAFRVGPRLTPNIAATMDATEQAYASGSLSFEQYKAEIKLIDQWAEILDAQAKESQKAGQ